MTCADCQYKKWEEHIYKNNYMCIYCGALHPNVKASLKGGT